MSMTNSENQNPVEFRMTNDELKGNSRLPIRHPLFVIAASLLAILK